MDEMVGGGKSFGRKGEKENGRGELVRQHQNPRPKRANVDN
jgi:hypothetical protein